MSNAQIDHLKSEADIQEYIKAALKDRDPLLMAAVLEDVKQAREALGLEKPPYPAEDEPFFITEEIEAEMIAAGYVFEPPPIVCTFCMRDVLERMTDAELALQPGEIADQERERRRRKPCSTS